MNLLNKTGLTYFWGKLKAYFVKGDARVYYGTCATAADTAAKVVTCPSFTSSDLQNGTAILVKFAETNTAAVGSLTMNVNNTGALSIKKVYNTSGVVSLNKAEELRGSTNLFVYTTITDGNTGYWVIQGCNYNSTYTGMSQEELGSGTSTTGRLLTPKFLRDNFYTESEVNALIPSVPVTDVTVGGTSVVSSGTAAIPAIPTVPTDVVKYSAQSLSDAEKSQARSNISAGTVQGNGKLFYGTCDTAAGTAAKVVTCPAFTSADLDAGSVILVKFAEANTASESNLTLNVNGTGALPIKKIANSAIANLAAVGEIRATTNLFILGQQPTSQYWIFANADYNTNTTYSAMTQTNITNGTSTTGMIISPKLLRDNFYLKSEVPTFAHLTDESDMPAIPDANTIYMIDAS